jgi:hypothetical protein
MEKNALRASVRGIAERRAAYNKRNLPHSGSAPFGPGRVDAFGAIFNEVSVNFLDVSENLRPANAPVSYPCLWDTPQHDRVQWNGAAENRVNPLGNILFGTSEVGALGRNAGEVLGVFGHADINDLELLLPRRYASTVNKAMLLRLEQSLKGLWSPQWPSEFGPLDEGLMRRGEQIFQQRCQDCHAFAEGNRTAANRRVEATIWDAQTDPTMWQNFGRIVRTGKLKNRQQTLLRLERFAETAPVGAVLRHVVERAILEPNLAQATVADALRQGLGAAEELNPGFQVTATIEVGDKKLVGTIDSISRTGTTLKITGGRFHVVQRNRDVLREGLGSETLDLSQRSSLESVNVTLPGVQVQERTDEAVDGAVSAEIQTTKSSVGYKARPLNGVWATAPYLHNGSVPTLAELLKPATQRKSQFRIGSLEFDPVNVGFQEDSNAPLFDAMVAGNSNAGHDYSGALNDGDRAALLEYLKSL